jgi:hypothetical protein
MKPCGFSIYLKYQCVCGTDHWLSQEEVKGQFVIVCDVCKKRTQIQPIEKITAKIDFKKCNKQSNKMANLGVKSANTALLPAVLDDAYQILKNYSFRREELERANISANSKEEFVKIFLARQK